MMDINIAEKGKNRWLTCSKRGSNHAKSGLPNQDCCLYGKVGTVSYMALADGVSSASGALEGALAAVQTVTRLSEEIDKDIIDIQNIPVIKKYIVQKWKRNFSEAWDTYATTLNLAVRRENRVLVGQIGDGIIIPDSNPDHIMAEEEKDFYTTETYALGECVLARTFRFEIIEENGHQGILMASDGVAKEIRRGAEVGLRDYIHDLSQKDLVIIKEELGNWFDSLDKKNGDDKTIAFWNRED